MKASEEKMKFPNSRRKGLKLTAWLAVVIALGIAGYTAYGKMNQKEVSYFTKPVAKGSITQTVQATGTIKPLHEADLNFKESVVLKELYVKVGDRVKAGQLLAVQDDVTMRSQLEQAESQYVQATFREEQAANTLAQAQKTYQRQKSLYESGALAASEYEQAEQSMKAAEIDLKTAKAQTQAAKASVALAREALEKAKMVAPFAGIVTEVNGEVGVATGSENAAFIHLIDEHLKIEAQVNEVDIGSVKAGQKVEFTVGSYPNKKFNGTVERVALQAETVNNVNVYTVDISVEDPNHELLPGMSVTADIIVSHKDDVTLVPTLALTYGKNYHPAATQDGNVSGQRRSGRPNQPSDSSGNAGASNKSALKNGTPSRVVVLANGVPVVRNIVVGISDSQNTEVIQGLKVGEQVIIGTNEVTSTKSNSSGNTRSGSQQSSPLGTEGSPPGVGGPRW